MAWYRCESCGGYYDEPYCEKEHRELTQRVDEASVPRDAIDAAIERSSVTLVTPGRPVSQPPSLPAQPREPEEPGNRATGHPGNRAIGHPGDQATGKPRTIPGLASFEAHLADGREAIVICGGSRSGKSEIASGYVRASTVHRGRAELQTLRASSKKQYTVGGTNPFEVWYQPAGERHIFLDPSGEFFNRLSPENSLEIEDYYFDFVRSAVEKLGGIVLVFDLTKEPEEIEHSPWLQQEKDFLFILAALRWLRFDKEARPPALGVGDAIATRAARQPRLDVPVVVLFSKGDLIPDYTRETPLRFAKRNLRTLHGALMTHAKRYHYDFCHTMKGLGNDARAVDPVGVLLAMEWLMDRRFGWIPRLPSYLLGGGK